MSMRDAINKLSRPRHIAVIAALVAATGAVAMLALVCSGSSSSEPTPTASASVSRSPTKAPTPPPTPVPQAVSPINGVLIPQDEFARLQQRAPLAVMIENDTTARPQMGMHRADLIYEAVSEGGITRFMAVYWRNEAERIEAIRSARVYYIHWAAELGAIYVHWGQVEDPGPVDVWPVLSRLNMRVMNGLFQGEAVGYRDPARYAPHNVYSDTGLLWSTAQGAGFAGPPTLESWRFKDDTPQPPAVPAIDIPFGNPGSDFAVRWEHDPASNSYLRTMGGVPHTDGITGERLSARNVVVQFAVLRPSGVKAYNIVDTVGTGSAVVFQDGVAIPGSWRKDSEAGRTRFYDAAGNEIVFNRGTIWVEVVPADSTIGY
jgi:Protein of unknown function (DUF3048) N-terminal domain/Protein of unknown function (DUF3048) C-terminal domain